METTNSNQVHVMFFPLMAPGHLLPTMDMAKLFATRGVKSTIITTPYNAPLFSKSIEKTRNSNLQIHLEIINFPSMEVGLPQGLENMELVTSHEILRKFFEGIDLLQHPLEKLLQAMNSKPQCLVADAFFPWAYEISAKFGIPRLVFHGTNLFSMCALESLNLYQPHKKVNSDTEEFILPNLPHEIRLTRLQLDDQIRNETHNAFTEILEKAKEADKKSYGFIVNSFYELESEYIDYFKNNLGRKAWTIGPVSLCNKKIEEKLNRGNSNSNLNNENKCLQWLNSKPKNSVVYICFGTTTKFSNPQLREIALGLESSGQNFIWVVKKHGDGDEEQWQPEKYEERLHSKGLIIRGWAPQVLILDHEAIGGFVTHCGWNSTLEGISAGVPMVTWPIFAEQFFNEKLITDVTKIGVGVGVKKWVRFVGDFVRKEGVEMAVKAIMVGEKAEEMRRRAKAFGEMSKRAVEEGGSSWNDLSCLIDELRVYSTSRS